MEIVSAEQADIPAIVVRLRGGATLVYPTETCYGLGCDARNAAAVERVFAIKQRQQEKSLLIVADAPAMMLDYVEWTEELEAISSRYWPGALTVVVSARRDTGLPPGVLAPDGTIAFRITAHPLVAAIVQELGAPLVSTSANIASHESPYDIAAVLSMFREQDAQPDIIIDGGALPERSPSTIVKLTDDGAEILRQGAVIFHEPDE